MKKIKVGPACKVNGRYIITSECVDIDGYPWGDETEVWLKMNKNDKVATNQVLMQELSITNK